MSNNTQNVATTTIANALVYNNRFATAKINADQIGVENLSQWKSVVNGLHRAAYTLGAYCENNGLRVENSSVDKTAVYDALRVILNSLGEVKGHKLYANEEAVIAIVGYACRRGNKDSAELQLCTTRISNIRRELAKAKEVNGINPALIESLEKELEEKMQEKSDLLDTEDMRIKEVTMTTSNGFRLDLEHFLARVINGQLAKSIEELDKEEEERKEKRKAAAKARKEARKQEQAKTEEVTNA